MEKLLREIEFPVKGTTKLRIGDPMYFEMIEAGKDVKNLKRLIFDGNISAASLGFVQIRQWKIEEGILSWEEITVDVYQGSRDDIINVYRSEKFWPSQVKKEIELGCDSASFEVETKFGDDNFSTGADGCYGEIKVMKQYYGMILRLYFDRDLFSFDEIVARIKTLWPEVKAKS